MFWRFSETFDAYSLFLPCVSRNFWPQPSSDPTSLNLVADIPPTIGVRTNILGILLTIFLSVDDYRIFRSDRFRLDFGSVVVLEVESWRQSRILRSTSSLTIKRTRVCISSSNLPNMRCIAFFIPSLILLLTRSSISFSDMSEVVTLSVRKSSSASNVRLNDDVLYC